MGVMPWACRKPRAKDSSGPTLCGRHAPGPRWPVCAAFGRWAKTAVFADPYSKSALFFDAPARPWVRRGRAMAALGLALRHGLLFGCGGACAGGRLGRGQMAACGGLENRAACVARRRKKPGAGGAGKSARGCIKPRAASKHACGQLCAAPIRPRRLVNGAEMPGRGFLLGAASPSVACRGLGPAVASQAGWKSFSGWGGLGPGCFWAGRWRPYFINAAGGRCFQAGLTFGAGFLIMGRMIMGRMCGRVVFEKCFIAYLPAFVMVGFGAGQGAAQGRFGRPPAGERSRPAQREPPAPAGYCRGGGWRWAVAAGRGQGGRGRGAQGWSSCDDCVCIQ